MSPIEMPASPLGGGHDEQIVTEEAPRSQASTIMALELMKFRSSVSGDPGLM